MSKKRVKAVYGRTTDGPMLMLPATAEAYDMMVEQVAITVNPESFAWCAGLSPWCDYRMEARDKARTTLRAIGITRPRNKT